MRIGGPMPRIALAGFPVLALGTILLLAGGMTTDDTSSEGLRLKGAVDMILYDEFGEVKDERHFNNLIVNTGLEAVASRIAPHDGTINPSAPFNYIALGTGNAAVSATDTTLAAELQTGAGYSRMQDIQASYSDTSAGKKLILSVTFLPGQATGTLSESGIFNAATNGDMLARQTFASMQKAADDTLTITWTITLSPT